MCLDYGFYFFVMLMMIKFCYLIEICMLSLAPVMKIRCLMIY